MKKNHPSRRIPPGIDTPVRNRLLLSFLLISACLLSPADNFADEQLDAQEMKAALVFKLTRFIQWPDETGDTKMERLTICSSASDPISPYLDHLKGETSYGRIIDVRHTDHAEEIKSACRILYVSRTRMPDGIYELKNSPVLTISDKLGFASKGGMIQISRRNEHLHFYINHASAVAAGIKISAPLLKISTIINHDSGDTK